MTTTAAAMRAWQGPAVLSFGFRPFFLMGGAWAALSMVVWLLLLTGSIKLWSAFDPVAWHAHELLFGYLGAIIAGFLLTAVPNWTGRLPVVGWPLAGLAALWLAGRVAIGMSVLIPPAMAAIIDLAFPVVLAGFLAREILAGGNWRNLPVLTLLAVWGAANALFHYGAITGDAPASGPGLRLGVAAAILLISLIGGRIVPSFTRNWLAARKAPHMPATPGVPDRLALVATAVALVGWIAAPAHSATALVCGVAGATQLYRLWLWRGFSARAEPLVWVLHAAYAFVPAGFLAIAAGHLLDWPAAAAQHLWMAGAIGLMTLAVMTRAALGHTGRPLHATPAITLIYVALIVSVISRLFAGLQMGPEWLLHLSALGWIASFGGFTLLYWPVLTGPRVQSKTAVARRADEK